MYYTPEPSEQKDPIVETYRGCNIYECAYECLFYATVFPDGTHTGAETIEEVKEAIDDYYAKNSSRVFRDETRKWIRSSWIMPWNKDRVMYDLMEHGSIFEVGSGGYIIHAPQNYVFSIKWVKMDNDLWMITKLSYKAI